MALLWGKVVKSGEAVEVELPGYELDLTQAVLLSEKPCSLRVVAENEVDLDEDSDNEEAAGEDDKKIPESAVLARLLPSRPNAAMHVVLTGKAAFMIEGPAGSKVQIVGNIRRAEDPSGSGESYDEDEGEDEEGEEGDIDPALLEKLRARMGLGKMPESGEADSAEDLTALMEAGGALDSDDDDDDDDDDSDDDQDSKNDGVPRIEDLDAAEEENQSEDGSDDDDDEQDDTAQAAAAAAAIKQMESKAAAKGKKGQAAPATAAGLAKLASGKASMGTQLREASPDNRKRAAEEKAESPDAKRVKFSNDKASAAQGEKNTATSSPSKKAKAAPPAVAPQSPIGLKQKLKAGVQFEVLAAGAGPVAAVGKKVEVQYEGRLQKTDKVFDKGSLSFVVGKGEMIAGFDLGVRGMMKGERRKISVPSGMGYGSKRMGPIPPNSDLIFEVTVKKIA